MNVLRYTGNNTLPIIKSGLTHFYDAGNLNSYPGTGTTLTDLSGNAVNGTLSAGITYSSSFGGSLEYNAVASDVVNLGSALPLASNLFTTSGVSFTVSTWYKWVTTPSIWGSTNHSQTIIGKSGGIAQAAVFSIFNSVNSGYISSGGGETTVLYRSCSVIRGAITNISPISINDNKWHNTVISWNGTTAKGYFDGVFIKNLNVGTASDNALLVGIGNRSGGAPDTNHRYQGSISSVLIYNKELTEREIFSNYSAYRARYY